MAQKKADLTDPRDRAASIFRTLDLLNKLIREAREDGLTVSSFTDDDVVTKAELRINVELSMQSHLD